MHPLLQYRIPFPDTGIHSAWHVIITDAARHFYFNAELQQSFWQLADVQHRFPEHSETGVDVDKLAAAIDFDAIAILMSKARGFPVREEIMQNQSERDTMEIKGNPEVSDTNAASISDRGDSPDSDTDNPVADVEIDTEARDMFISALLSDEAPQPALNPEQSGTPPLAAPAPASIIGGYSSGESDEESDSDQDPNNEEEARERNLEKTANGFPGDTIISSYGDNEPPKNSQSAEFDFESLDDDIPDNDRVEFMLLLSTLKPKFDMNLPWLLVEEDLMTELVQCPEYYAVSNAEIREQLYNEWCSIQTPCESTDTQITGIYPTLAVKLLHFLQLNKGQAKRLFFPEFKARMHQSLQEFMPLGEKKIEILFRQFRIMIEDFAAHEKRIKASPNYDPLVNLKRLELEKFLRAQFPVIKASCNPPPESESRQVHDQEIPDFNKWMDLANRYSIPVLVIESVTNFVVGDEKRLACYENLVKEFSP